MIVDPLNPNYAIAADGSPLVALRICKIKDPTRVTVKEINDSQIVGYTPGPIGSGKLTEGT